MSQVDKILAGQQAGDLLLDLPRLIERGRLVLAATLVG